MIGCITVTKPLVITLFGNKWIGMVPVLRILCVVGLMQSITTVVGSVFLSQGHSDIQFRLGLALKPILIVAIIVGLFWGLTGVCIGYTIGVIITQYFNIKWAGKLVEITYKDMLVNLFPTFILSIIMGIVVLASNLIINVNVAIGVSLLLKIIIGFTTYLMLLIIFKIRAYNELILLLKEFKIKEFINKGIN